MLEVKNFREFADKISLQERSARCFARGAWALPSDEVPYISRYRRGYGAEYAALLHAPEGLLQIAFRRSAAAPVVSAAFSRKEVERMLLALGKGGNTADHGPPWEPDGEPYDMTDAEREWVASIMKAALALWPNRS